MRYSVGVEYAFHSLFYMVEAPEQGIIGIRALAQLHGVSETYLSKIFTKLRKGGIVRSIPGVKGGYVLQHAADQISFWDIIEAIEGNSRMFQCAEIRQNNILAGNEPVTPNCPCTIKVIMDEAEEKMRSYLQEKTLLALYQETTASFSKEKKQAIQGWLKENVRKM